MSDQFCPECHSALDRERCESCDWMTPAARAARALSALHYYRDWPLDTSAAHDEDVHTAATDLIADLHHMIDALPDSEEWHKIDTVIGRDTRWDAVLDSADLHYRAEKDEAPLSTDDLAEAQHANAERIRCAE